METVLIYITEKRTEKARESFFLVVCSNQFQHT